MKRWKHTWKQSRGSIRFLLHHPEIVFGAALVFIWLSMSCTRSTTSSYPRLKATLSLLAQQDSTALRHPVWAPSGFVYYISHPLHGDTTYLVRHDPLTHHEQIVAESVRGPLAVAADGKIACLESSYRMIVFDSTGIEIWAQNVGSTVSHLAFSADNDTIYYCKNGSLLRISIGSASPHDTLLKEIAGFSKSPHDSVIIYLRMVTANGDSLPTFYKYDMATGEQTLILQEGSASGFALNPVSMSELAVGVTVANELSLPGHILLHHIDHGLGRIFEATPYDLAAIHVESWEPEGTILLMTVTPLIEGDPPITLPEEIWMAEDIY